MSSIQASTWAQEQMPEALEELPKETFIREKDIERADFIYVTFG